MTPLARLIVLTFGVIVCAVANGGPLRAGDGAVTVFAAASLGPAMEEVGRAYPHGVTVSVAGSGAVARQIAQGAPGDVVVLANSAWMEWLVARGVVAQPVALLGNRLVLIGPAGSAELPALGADALLARLAGGRMAMGQTRGVPAGIYGRAWLEAEGLWPALAPHLAEVENVRIALALVARGETPLGLVYATDALAEPGVRVLYTVPEAPGWQVVYPGAALSDAGRAFLEYLGGPAAQAIFAHHGFVPLGAP